MSEQQDYQEINNHRILCNKHGGLITKKYKKLNNKKSSK